MLVVLSVNILIIPVEPDNCVSYVALTVITKMVMHLKCRLKHNGKF